MKKIIQFFLLSFLVLNANKVFAVTKTISTAGGNWNADATWLPTGAPAVGDHVVCTTSSGQLTVNVNSTIGSMDLTLCRRDLVLGANLTVTNALTAVGINGDDRLFIRSDTKGTARTLSAGSISAAYVDFQDITVAGAANWNLANITGGSGNCWGNTGITFSTPQTIYYKTTTGTSASPSKFSDAKWFTTSGGSTAARMPICQDTAIFDRNSFSTIGLYFSNDVERLPNINFLDYGWKGRVVFNRVGGQVFNGDILYSKMLFGISYAPSVGGFTYRGNTGATLAGRGNHELAMGGGYIVESSNTTVDTVTGTYTLIDSYSLNFGDTWILNSGHLVLAPGSSMNVAGFSIPDNSYTKTLDLNNASLTVNGNYDFQATNFTLDAGSSAIIISSCGVRTFSGGDNTFATVIASTNGCTPPVGALTITGNNTFENLVIRGNKTVKFADGSTQNIENPDFTSRQDHYDYLYDHAIRPSTITSVSGTGSAGFYTLNYTGDDVVEADHVYVSQGIFTPSNKWYFGNYSVNAGGNTGALFRPRTVPTTGRMTF